ncbi:TRAP transporter small permease [Pseudonocardia acaciae]|uniref:TRAP transporter small permease n=1 Tax=Pseudonocardia acaciae TaxID=551276 RepID=UPI00048AE0CA|nr:TRAP transporter small permease [Pseudonocardia acaciae]
MTPSDKEEARVSRFDAVLTRVENVLAAGSLGLAVLIAIVAVLLRALFNEIIFWSEEAIVYLVITSTFVGAVITLRHNEHVNVELVSLFLKERGKRIIKLVGVAVSLVYLGVVGTYGWFVLFEPYATNTITPALKLPLWAVMLPVPVGFTLMFLRTCEVGARLLRGRDPYPEAAGDELEGVAS